MRSRMMNRYFEILTMQWWAKFSHFIWVCLANAIEGATLTDRRDSDAAGRWLHYYSPHPRH